MVRMLRARAYCCRRNWENAKEDYKTVLKAAPDDSDALAGLALVITPPEDLPFMNADFSF
jgi:Tfp pilus assembly protein PilF